MDFLTLFIVFGVVVLSCAFSLLVLAWQFRDQLAAGCWAFMLTAISFGFISFSVYAATQQPLFAFIGNLLPLIGLPYLIDATRLAAGGNRMSPAARLTIITFIAAVVTMTSIWFGLIEARSGLDGRDWFGPRAHWSAIISSSVISAGCAYTLAYITQHHLLRIRYWTTYIVGISLYLLSSLARMAAIAVIDKENTSALATTITVYYVVIIAASILVTLGAMSITAGNLWSVLKQAAVRDPLTDLLNRRGFQERFDRSRRQQDQLALDSLIVVDIDKFKSINDRFGHDVGDEVIKNLGNLLQCEIRADDILARFGGEEFVIALPNTQPGEATEIANRLLNKVRNVAVETLAGKIKYTVSLGITSAPRSMEFTKLFKDADNALLHAKETGRNRAVARQILPDQ